MEMRISFTLPDEVAAALLPTLIRDILDAQPDAWRLDGSASPPCPSLEPAAETITVGQSHNQDKQDHLAASEKPAVADV
jgi:hypothetical protein